MEAPRYNLPYRDLRWSLLPRSLRVVTLLATLYTLVSFVYIFSADPIHLTVVPIVIVPAAFGVVFAGLLARNTPLPDRVYGWTFLIGGTLGTLLAGIGNTTASRFLGEDVVVLFTAPIFEELIKTAIIAVIITSTTRITPTIVNRATATATGIVVGAGFTFVEDIIYLAKAYNYEEVLTIALGRSFMSPFVHMACTALVGYGIGLLLEARQNARRNLAGLFTAAVLLHIMWNVASQLSVTLAVLLSFLVTGSFLGVGLLYGKVISQRIRERIHVAAGVGLIDELELGLLRDPDQLIQLHATHRTADKELSDLHLAAAEACYAITMFHHARLVALESARLNLTIALNGVHPENIDDPTIDPDITQTRLGRTTVAESSADHNEY